MRIPLPILLAAVLALALPPARATSNYTYRKNEYVIINHGRAPNRQVSLASHGSGDLGYDGFHVWLMAEPGHRKIEALANIDENTILDTAADSFNANWSTDSRYVGVTHRSSRHEIALDLYRIEDRHAHAITGPSLFKEATGREVGEDDDLRERFIEIEWHAGNRFRLREFKSFIEADDSLTRLFGKYGHVAEKLDGGKLFIQFVADAECEMLPGDQYRIVELKPGDPDHWK